MNDVHRTIEVVARESYGRLIAFLSARLRDVTAAEDALGDAFLAALTTWPRDGLPQKPEAWLLTAARNRLIDRARHDRRLQSASAAALELITAKTEEALPDGEFPDERLTLMFVCAHPAIDPAVHTPLMLQTVLGLDAAAIARAFLVSPAAMGQRLVRAKAKIRDAGIAFEVPDEAELPERLDAVLEAIYAAYGSGWDDAAGADPRARGLADEAIWLARVVVQRLPEEPEARGLLALILHCESRRPARRAPDGRYVPLSEQDPELWSKPMIVEAEQVLVVAAERRTTRPVPARSGDSIGPRRSRRQRPHRLAGDCNVLRAPRATRADARGAGRSVGRRRRGARARSGTGRARRDRIYRRDRLSTLLDGSSPGTLAAPTRRGSSPSSTVRRSSSSAAATTSTHARSRRFSMSTRTSASARSSASSTRRSARRSPRPSC